jgi:hypothetical protein
MNQPPVPPRDDKDWTWVLGQTCPQCGFDAATVSRDELAARVLTATDEIRAALLAPDAANRPSPDVWSRLEYACHVRDVCRIFGERLRLMLDTDDPIFPDWDQNETALADRYWQQSPTVIADELSAAAQRTAQRFADVTAEHWERPGRRSNGSVFTVESLGRYMLHDLVHHVHDTNG